jgi:hypothetical protein
MKKLLLVLLVVTLASFLFVGCLPGVVVDDDDDDGDGVVTGVTVDIEDSVVIDGKTYVQWGNHTVTVTFPEPVAGNVEGYLSPCSGDLSKAVIVYDGTIVLFPVPDTDRKVWEGSVFFGDSELIIEDGYWWYGFGWSPCCASILQISAGECVDEYCIELPVIIDWEDPFAEIEWEVDNCPCEDCAITFTSVTHEPDCEDPIECCEDCCSGLASWSFTLYDEDPFDKCCDPDVCEEPIDSGSGTCPIEFTTDCLAASDDPYYLLVDLVDNVGLETTYYAKIFVSGGSDSDDECIIEVFEGWEEDPPECVDWDTYSTDHIGECWDCDYDYYYYYW